MRKIIGFLLAALLSNSSMAEVATVLEMRAARDEARAMVFAQDFDGIEVKLSEYQKSKARTRDGHWKLAQFYGGVSAGFESLVSGNDMKSLEYVLLKHTEKYPESTNAWIIYAIAMHAKAWDLRGFGLANTVTPEGWEGFRKFMGKARDALDTHKTQLASNPAWYSFRVKIAHHSGEGPDIIDGLFLEGITKESTYHPLFYTVMDSRHPLWGGSIQSSVKFINAFVKNATYEESVATYARLFVYLDSPLFDTARNEVLDWALMKRSFSAVLDKYPDDFNSQKYLLMACYKGDKAETKRLLAYIKEEPSSHSIGPETLMFKNCVRWASGGYTFAITDPKTGQVEFRE